MTQFAKFQPITWRNGKSVRCRRCKRKIRPGTPEARESRRVSFAAVDEFPLCGTCIPAMMNDLAGEFEVWSTPPPPPRDVVFISQSRVHKNGSITITMTPVDGGPPVYTWKCGP